ncbi:MAG TPA: N-acetylmuramoyl-L-alanine amidase, partial [Paracoccus sp. (in: a-proteobacteria)]|nr:N-acetylmuramoyl-L-alanine amidase [Paracoccus sp. (in: a-proteobacteria)]
MRQFLDMGLEEFVDLLETFDFTRTVTEVHLHHSWRPRQAEFLGRDSLQDIWRDHKETHHLSDFAQHVTVDPNGRIWLGRNFNRAPASARGFNGNDRVGPFMVVMIGDLAGDEKPTEAQLQATLGVIAAVQRHAGLAAAALRLHQELTGAPCPGLAREALVEGLAAVTLPKAGARTSSFPSWATRNHELLSALAAVAGPAEDMTGAELPHGPGSAASRSGARADPELSAFADHWINLDRGRFSAEGRLTTSQADVDRIFRERLPAEIERAKAQGQPLNLLFYAHGGLVSEDVGITHMTTQTPVWMANGVFPIFFIWETGFWRSIRDLLAGGRAREAAPRLPWADRALEEAARLFGGPSIWDVMKLNALRANSQDGGALYAAGLLKKLMDANKDDLRVHAVGHSAGSIFHAHFLQDLLGDKKRRIETLSLLAPAARADLFTSRVLPLIAADLIGETTIHTM